MFAICAKSGEMHLISGKMSEDMATMRDGVREGPGSLFQCNEEEISPFFLRTTCPCLAMRCFAFILILRDVGDTPVTNRSGISSELVSIVERVGSRTTEIW